MAFPVFDERDIEILQHRDAHFGGNFAVMLDYYAEEGVGAMADFPLERLEELQRIQEAWGENLSLQCLPPHAEEEVHKAQELYKRLRDLYEHQEATLPLLISDLILSEAEEPVEEMRAIVAQGEKMVDPLIQLVDSMDFYNPLYPGYGRTPAFAARCLAKLQSVRAIPHLFQALGQENLDVEEALIASLVALGAPAKAFLLGHLSKQPLSKDNLNAAITLASFPPSEEVAKQALTLLANPTILAHESFPLYLVCLSEGLKTAVDRQVFASLTRDLPALKLDRGALLRSWKDMSL